MADNNFRPFGSRDPIAREEVDPLPYDKAQDPLAELARLIGQRERGSEADRGARYNGSVETLDHPAPAPAAQDWAADERYAEPNEPEQQYAEESYVQPRLPEAYPSDRAPAPARYNGDDGYAPAPAARYAEPADGYDDPHDSGAEYRDDDTQYRDDARADAREYAPRYRDEHAPPPRAVGRQLPAVAPQARDDRYEADDDQWDDERGDDQSSAAEEYYDDETQGTSRRSGLVVVLAMVGLVLIGAAGAYAYRAMFGGAILVPSLPPIIKPADGPIKVVPAQQGASNQAGAANPGAPAQLVPREEQPVAVQPPPPPPRVLSTIPVAPTPGTVPPAGPVPPANTLAPTAPATTPAPVQPKGAAAQPSGTAPALSTEPKKVHTVPIRPDQMGNGDTSSAAAAAPTAPAQVARPKVTEPVAKPAPAPKAGGNAPLSLVPGAQGAASPPEPPRTRVARSEPLSAPVATAPAAAAAPSAGGAGGYAVQVTSQRSEAEAQAAFKALQGKFPGQLGNRAPIIHRADLGDKGTYYRAMVGPFGSAEAAASMCSSLKAAGGSCLVQKN